MDTTTTSRRRISAPSHHRQRKAHAISLLPMPPAPPEMSAVAAAEWVRIGARAIAIGVLPDIDRSIFAAYCNAVGDLADVRSAWTLEGRPATVMRPSGQRPHPSLETLRQPGGVVQQLVVVMRGQGPRQPRVEQGGKQDQRAGDDGDIPDRQAGAERSHRSGTRST